MLFDQLLASREERIRASQYADEAIAQHGDQAADVLREKLNDPRRRKSLRALRLALAHIEKHGLPEASDEGLPGTVPKH